MACRNSTQHAFSSSSSFLFFFVIHVIFCEKGGRLQRGKEGEARIDGEVVRGILAIVIIVDDLGIMNLGLSSKLAGPRGENVVNLGVGPRSAKVVDRAHIGRIGVNEPERVVKAGVFDGHDLVRGLQIAVKIPGDEEAVSIGLLTDVVNLGERVLVFKNHW